MKYKNKDVEKFFLEFLPKHEDVTMSQCTLWLHNYYKEVEEEETFNSKYFDDQDERMETMFPGLPVDPMNLMKYKAYKHRSEPKDKGGHDETGFEERIIILDTAVKETVYSEYSVRRWWN